MPQVGTTTDDHPPTEPQGVRQAPPPPPAGRTTGRLAPRLVVAATVAVGAGLAVLVGLDGSPAWQVVRVAVVVGLAAVAVRTERRAGARARGWVGLAAGLVGTIASSMGLAHLIDAGLTATAVAGLVALAAGLVLAGWSAVALVRLARGWRKLWAIPVAFLILQLVVMPLTVAVLATNVPPDELADRTPADRGLAHEEVTLRTDDGVDLAAWYVPSSNGAAVLLLHGAGSTRTAVLDHAEVLAGAGYGVLMVDARGHGDSGGRAMDLGWSAETDLAPAVAWLTERPDVEPGRIGAVGLSMGGEQALTAAGADPRIAAVVSEGASRRVAADAGVAGTDPQGLLFRAVEWIQFTAADLLSEESPPDGLHEVVRAIDPRPVLLIAGTPSEEREAAQWLQEAAPGSVEVWEVDTGHTAGLRTLRGEWVDRVTGFVDDATG